MKKCFYLLLLFSYFQIQAQTSYGVGNWKYHFAMGNIEHVVDGGNYIFCAGPSSLFYYSKEEQSTNEINKIDGLSGTNVTAIAYYEPDDLVVIGYQTGVLDLYSVERNEILSMNAISRSDITGSKQINDLYVYGNLIYISTNFGVVVYDHKNEEVKETYRNIGPNGEELQIYSTEIQEEKDSIYVRTEMGIHGASLKSNNLLFFKNWQYFPESKNTDWALTNLDFWKGETLFSTDSGGVYTLSGDEFNKSGYDTLYSNLVVTGEKLIRYRSNAMLIEDADSSVNTYEFSNFSINTVQLIDGQIWLGTNGAGLIWYNGEDDYRGFQPPGPPSNTAFRFSNLDGDFLILPARFKSFYVPGVYKKQGQYWEMMHTDFMSVSDVALNTITNEKVFSSQTYGLYIISQDGTITNFSDQNPIVNKNGVSQPSPITKYWPSTLALGTDIDTYGNTWFITYGGIQYDQIFVLDREWNITGFNVDHPWMEVAWDIEVDPNAPFLWIQTLSGLIVYDYENDRYKTITSDASGGFLYGNVSCIAFDKNDDLWLGTEKGVTVLYDTYRVFDDINYDDSPPVFERQPLLFNEYINCMYVDGGNRKWFGTANGAWLVSESGTEQLLHFNSENSPLPSNNVSAVGVNENNGEVFFSLNEGIVSYWGDATEAEETHEESVKVFPNPVAPEFDGQIAITGLARNSIVKITDISGNLVYETQANGGMAIWDGKRNDGKKPDTGVYLVYSAEPSGNDGYVAKIVFIQ